MTEEKKSRETDVEEARPDPEVPAVAVRRRFSASYKRRVLKEVERRKAAGEEIGSYLRREGLTTSHISSWRKSMREGSLSALEPKKRGRKNDPDVELRRENQRLRAEKEALEKKLEQAELVIDVQKKLSRLLGLEGLS